MWSKSTKPCPIITWDGVAFNGEHRYVDHIYYMIHVWPFGLRCSEAMSVHARLVKFNPSIPHVQNCLAPVVCERRAYHTRSSRGVLAWRTVATVHTQGEHLYLEILVRDHLVLLISISKAPSWSPTSPAWHLDLHHSVMVVSPTMASTTIANA